MISQMISMRMFSPPIDTAKRAPAPHPLAEVEAAGPVTALGISADGRRAWFAGVARDGRSVVVYVEDKSEPGREDVFKLWLGGVLQTGDGRLGGGNIQIGRS
jgi:hypothetical protein